MPLGLAHETHKLSQPLRVGVDSLGSIHLFPRIDHKILYGNKQTQSLSQNVEEKKRGKELRVVQNY